MVYNFVQVVAAAGTRTPLTTAGTRVAATYLTVQAKVGNTGNIFLGDKTVAAASPGITLLPGDSYTFPECGSPSPYDLQQIFIDAASNGDGVTGIYFKR